jgi:hypothetical protein
VAAASAWLVLAQMAVSWHGTHTGIGAFPTDSEDSQSGTLLPPEAGPADNAPAYTGQQADTGSADTEPAGIIQWYLALLFAEICPTETWAELTLGMARLTCAEVAPSQKMA